MAISSVGSNARPGVCTSTTRPTTPFEGQLIYETDTDMLAIWNGSAWRYVAATTPTSGTVLQVVSATYSTIATTSSTSFVDTGLSASITPKSSSSKILVNVMQSGCGRTGGNGSIVLNLVRGSTQLATHNGGYTANTNQNIVGTMGFTYLDGPSTTSSTTYKTQYRADAGGMTVITQDSSSLSSITLMEIAG